MLATLFSAFKTLVCEAIYAVVGEFFIRLVF